MSTQLNIPTSNIQSFNFHNQEIRTELINFETWWCLADVCQVLGIKDPSRLADRLNKNGTTKSRVIDSMGREQEAIFINESNLYKTIFRSNKPEAREFEDWVTGDVLPTLRKTGTYSVPGAEQARLDTPSTKEDRKPLANLVNTLVDCAPFSYRNAWHLVHAHMGGKHAEDFTLAELPVAMAFVQEQINLHTARPVLTEEQTVILNCFNEFDIVTRSAILIICGNMADKRKMQPAAA